MLDYLGEERGITIFTVFPIRKFLEDFCAFPDQRAAACLTMFQIFVNIGSGYLSSFRYCLTALGESLLQHYQRFCFSSGQLSVLIPCLFMGLTNQKFRDGYVYMLDTLELLLKFKETTHLLVSPAAFAGCGDG